jgi:uncharacterized protein (TIGR00156 family)
VAQALKANDDTDVTLKGEITRAVGDGKFIFEDGTGSVVIDVVSYPFAYYFKMLLLDRQATVSGDVDVDRNGDREINVTRISPAE